MPCHLHKNIKKCHKTSKSLSKLHILHKNPTPKALRNMKRNKKAEIDLLINSKICRKRLNFSSKL